MDTKEKRQNLKSSHPQVYLEEKHTKNCRAIPSRDILIKQLPQKAIIAEVGVAFGDYSEVILKTNNPKKLYLVDAWSHERYDEGLACVEDKFKDEIESGKVEIHQGLSTDVLPTLPDNHFDMIYIDTKHSYATTAQELYEAKDKVAVGGYLAGHDFCTGNVVTPVVYGVTEAVNEFCVEHDWEYKYITLEPHGTFSFCIQKIGS